MNYEFHQVSLTRRPPPHLPKKVIQQNTYRNPSWTSSLSCACFETKSWSVFPSAEASEPDRCAWPCSSTGWPWTTPRGASAARSSKRSAGASASPACAARLPRRSASHRWRATPDRVAVACVVVCAEEATAEQCFGCLSKELNVVIIQ